MYITSCLTGDSVDCKRVSDKLKVLIQHLLNEWSVVFYEVYFESSPEKGQL